jgi:hypothetical protein
MRGIRWLRQAQIFVSVVAISSGLWILFSLWNDIRTIEWRISLFPLLVSFMALLAALSGWAWIWAWLVCQLGSPEASRSRLATALINSNIAKYLPGSLWNYFARFYLGRDKNVAQKSVWLANVLEILVALGAGFIWYGLSLLWPHHHQSIISPELSIALGLMCFALGSPAVMALANHVTAAIPRLRWAGAWPTLPWLHYLLFVVISLLTWIWVGGAFWILVLSVYPNHSYHPSEIVGGWLFSFVTGLLAIGVPQGIGVRDGVLVLILSATIPVPVAITLAALSRLWLIAGDFATPLLWNIGKLGYSTLRRHFSRTNNTLNLL